MFLTWQSALALDDYRFVVVGAGPAGLYLARALANRGRVLVVEAGKSEDLYSTGEGYYDLVSTGRDYPTTGTRLSAFGGTSNHWGGHSHPFTAEIFANRPGIAGWPIAHEDFAFYLDGAASFLNLTPFREERGANSLQLGLLGGYMDLLTTRFQYSDPMVHLGEPAFGAPFVSHPDIHILLETRVTEFELSPDGSRVQSIGLLHRPSREALKGPVQQLVLCAGGIENARLLLWSGRSYPAGNPLVGGPNQLTGLYFTEKPYLFPVEIFFDGRVDLSDAVPHGGVNGHFAWELSQDFRARHGLPRFGVFPDMGEVVAVDDSDLDRIAPFYVGQSPSYLKTVPAFQFEQTPHKGSFVKLSDALDADGFARPELHWQVLASDVEAYRRATLLFCGVLNQKGFAKARLKPEFRPADWMANYIGTSNHHIGTTRMGDSPLDGVVDRDCRVFGVDNLFVAGSSIFPSGDYVNPTLNLVALAGRLAEHLISTMRTRLRFGEGAPDNAALVSGWSHLEGGGVWSEGNSARLEIAGKGARAVVLGGQAFHDTHGSLSINGAQVFSGALRDAIGRPFVVAPADQLVLDFRIVDPSSPKSHGDNDETRLIGIFLSGLELR